MKILLSVPTFENIQPEVFESLWNMDKGGHKVDFKVVRGYDCARARNMISMEAIRGEYDYLMMVDSDTIVPKDALINMLDPEEAIVLGCCPRKNTKKEEFPMSPISCYDMSKCLYAEDLKDKRIELRVGGFACALIDVKIFDLLKFPYFVYENHKNGKVLSEDYYFCLKAVSQGLHIWADPRVRCGHLARYYQYK